jgi:hypothetical protein
MILKLPKPRKHLLEEIVIRSYGTKNSYCFETVVYAVTQLENDTLLMQERVHKFK